MFHIWEFGRHVNVRLRKEFEQGLRQKIKVTFASWHSLYSVLPLAHIPFDVFKDRLKPSYKNFINLEIYLALCKVLEISPEELEKNIVAYKLRKGSSIVYNPVLPVKITPLFDMLIAHHIGDGYVLRAPGRELYFGYRQYNSLFRLNYIKKLESVFGKIFYKYDYFTKGTNVYAPAVLSQLFFKAYKLNEKSFLSATARIPPSIFQKSKEHLLAVLIAFIIDEGHVDSTCIDISVKNFKLAKDIQQLCTMLEYENRLRERADGMVTTYVLKEGFKKFYEDYRTFVSRYPEASLGFKQDLMTDFIARLSKPRLYLPGNRTAVLNLLETNSLSSIELSQKLFMTRQGAGYLLRQLKKEGKVTVEKQVGKTYKWAIV